MSVDFTLLNLSSLIPFLLLLFSVGACCQMGNAWSGWRSGLLLGDACRNCQRGRWLCWNVTLGWLLFLRIRIPKWLTAGSCLSKLSVGRWLCWNVTLGRLLFFRIRIPKWLTAGSCLSKLSAGKITLLKCDLRSSCLIFCRLLLIVKMF